VHQVVDAREEEPFAAAQAADERVLQGARLRLVAGEGRGRALDNPLAGGQAAAKILPRRIQRPGMPATTTGASAGKRPCAASDAAVTSLARASRAWPSACATVQSASPPDRLKAVAGSA